MRPILYSEKNAQHNGIGWMRIGHHINYARNLTNLNCPLLSRDRTHFMLEWQMVYCYVYLFILLNNTGFTVQGPFLITKLSMAKPCLGSTRTPGNLMRVKKWCNISTELPSFVELGIPEVRDMSIKNGPKCKSVSLLY